MARRADAGFTLAEMLVVLAIMAMVGLIVAQSAVFRRTPSTAALASSIAAELRRVSLKAVTTAMPRAIGISVEDGTLLTGGPEPSMTVPDTYALELTTAEELAGSDEGRIVFFPDGASTGGEIRIVNAGGAGHAVTVHWLTGAIETRALP